MAEGTHLSEAASPVCTTSWCSSTASGTQAPLELAQRKEGMMHASPGSSFRDANIFQRKSCSFFEGDREGRVRRASLPPKQSHVYTATRCQAQATLLTRGSALHRPHSTDLCVSGMWLCPDSSASHKTLPSEAEQEALGDHYKLPVPEKLVLRIAVMEQLCWFWFL